MARYILQRIRYPYSETLPYISVSEALPRIEALLSLRADARVQRDISLG